jgi:uncharacterized surface protein with fasciclin (FAS1) repeats
MSKSTITIMSLAAAGAVAVLPFQRALAQPEANETIVAVAAGNADFSTLVSALRAADLVEALQGAGPFTVFAPNNAAFAKLPPGTLEDLLKPENKKKLAGILKNHVIEGKVMAADVKSGAVKTLDGEKVEVAVENGKVGFGGAQVIATDIAASNGVIHVIDTVVLPD